MVVEEAGREGGTVVWIGARTREEARGDVSGICLPTKGEVIQVADGEGSVREGSSNGAV